MAKKTAKRSQNFRGHGKKSFKSSQSDNKYGNSGSHVGGESASIDEAKASETQYDAHAEKGRNDVNFYVVSEQILKDVASYSWNQATGTRVQLNNPLFATLSTEGSFAVPGVITEWIVPSYGYVTDRTGAINVAASYMYTFVRHANSGSRNYDPNDLFLAVAATAEVFAAISWAKRIYETMGEYQFFNRYFPEAVLEQQGVNFDDIKHNLPQFRARLNLAIRSLRQFAIPSTLPIFARRVQIFSAMYKEGDTQKDQLYQFTPEGFMRFSLDTDGAGQLEFDTWQSHATTNQRMGYEDILGWIEAMVRDVMTVPDISLIMGDVLKAYGSNLVTMGEIHEDSGLVVSTDLSVLEQFKNATVIPWNYYNHPTLSQDPSKGFLVFTPKCVVGNSDALTDYQNAAQRNGIQTLTEDRLLTTIRVEPTPGDVMEMTRLTVAAESFSASETGWTTVNLITGSEIVTNCTMSEFVYDVDSGQLTMSSNQLQYYLLYDTTAASAVEITRDFRVFARASNFKFHPAMHVLSFRQSQSNPAAVNFADAYFFYDVDNFMTIHKSDVDAIHRAALLAEYGLS